ncbi:N-6 DNA methylase [Nocardia asteroides]|uniref:N-6 DNA methylase n=1 Tax=Nocardia asteroides TaxID=1824 RepID=UPI0037CB3126
MALVNKEAQELRRAAMHLVDSPNPLTESEKEFVLTHYHSDANTNGLHGAYFTPLGLARQMALELPDRGDRPQRILDACAGIGGLAFASRNDFDVRYNGAAPREFVCVEANPEYLRVGKKIMPEATWVHADILDLPSLNLGRFDAVISNPPHGPINRDGKNSPHYRGRRFEYHVIDTVADYVETTGVFLIPQSAAPFRFSGQPHNSLDVGDVEYHRFLAKTGITLGYGLCLDTDAYRGQWTGGVSPATEIAVVRYYERALGANQPGNGPSYDIGVGAAVLATPTPIAASGGIDAVPQPPKSALVAAAAEPTGDPTEPSLALFDL